MVIREEKPQINKSRLDKSSTGSVKLIQPTTNQDKVEEPDFMKYMRGVNFQQNDQEYLKKHFDEEDELAVQAIKGQRQQ